MRAKTVIFALVYFFISCKGLYSESPQPKCFSYYHFFQDETAERTYLRDTVSWLKHCCWVRDSLIYYNEDPNKELWEHHTQADIKTVERHYENRDLVFYKNSSTDAEQSYWRRKPEKVIVTDGPLDKSYIRLGTFTIALPAPPDWKKYMDRIQMDAYLHFSADAAKIERWEILPFKREDFAPVTEFKNGGKYVLYHCVAVTFADTVPLTREELKKYQKSGLFIWQYGLSIDTAAEAHEQSGQ